MLFVLYSLLCLAVTSSATPILYDRAADPTVTLDSGVVVGTATRVANQPSVTGLANAYLGVPFASSPPLRFAPPTSPKPWTEPLVAQKLPPACLQSFGSGAVAARTKEYFNNPGYEPPQESEDCLYLNVFTPPDASPTNLKPVLFWLFGGNLAFGTASLGYYNGSSLAVNEDVVVVVINYRTNIFGFSNSPDIPFGQQNSGLLDQRFALLWTRSNIARFGGDPDKITIFGESAGGESVKQLLAQSPSPRPFRAAIMESQNTLLIGDGKANYNKVLSHFGCASLECIRGVAATDIQTYVDNEGLQFPPVEDGTYTNNILPSIVSGKFANVPILMGTNLDEAQIFLAVAGLDSGTSVVDGVLALTGLNVSSIENSLVSMYAAKGIDGGLALLNRVLTDLLFTCTTQTVATAVQLANRQRIWRYQYDATFPNLQLFPNAGAYHTAEIPSVWGTYPTTNQFGSVTPTQISLSSYMQGAWAGFAKDPSNGPGWPRLGSAFGVELGALGSDQAPSGEKTVPLLQADYACALYDPILIAANLAY
ncbi:hypothetical protein MBLNU13_g01165t1 [Cladosporium sp. NU13]